jgi:hypothetical protein
MNSFKYGIGIFAPNIFHNLCGNFRPERIHLHQTISALVETLRNFSTHSLGLFDQVFQFSTRL